MTWGVWSGGSAGSADAIGAVGALVRRGAARRVPAPPRRRTVAQGGVDASFAQGRKAAAPSRRGEPFSAAAGIRLRSVLIGAS